VISASSASAKRPRALGPQEPARSQAGAIVHRLQSTRTAWDLPHAGPGTTTLLRAGAPDRSALVARMRSRPPSTQMPPLGTVLPDREAIDLRSRWIEELGAGH
jgi:hypothetical protein